MQSVGTTTWWLGKERFRLALLIAVALSAFVTGINWGLPQATNPETVQPWALDTIAPIAPLNEAYYRFTRSGNEYVVYPLLHYVVLSAAYLPYMAVAYLSGDLSDPSSTFPYGIRDVARFCQDLTLLARLVSLLMALGIVLIIYVVTRDLAGQRAAFWSALCCSLIAPLSYYAKTSNLDVPYSFWVCLAIWRYVRILDAQRIRDYVLLGMFAALAVATKDQAYGFFLLTPFVLAYSRARRETAGRISTMVYVRAFVSPPMLFAGVTAIVVYAAANNVFMGGFDGLLRHFARGGNVFDYRQETDVAFYSLAEQARLLGRTAVLLAQMLGPLTLALSCAGILMAWRQRNLVLLSLLVFSVSYYLFVIVVFDIVFSRYLLVSTALLAPFFGVAVTQLLEPCRRWRPVMAAIITIALLSQAALVLNLNLTLVADSRYAMANWIRSNVAPGAVIEAQVRQRMLPYISTDYEVRVAGNSGDAITMQAIESELTETALVTRNPDYILILQGLGVTGDPTGWDTPGLRAYYRGLSDGSFGYKQVARFDTPHFLPFRQIPGTRPTSILLARSRGPDE